jgi:tellurite resistance protein
MSSIDSFFDEIMGGMTKEEAFYALLAAAMLIDEEEHAQEAEELTALVHRTRTLSAVSRSDMTAIEGKIRPRLAKDKIKDLVADACSSLKQEKPEVALAIFGHACDIIFADRVVKNQEKAFLKDLIGHLGISEAEAETMLKAIRAKNEH